MALLRDTSEMNIEPSRRIFSNLPKDGIRLVHIQQGSIVDDMECRVEEATLSDTSLSYEALSYVWGTFDMKKYISVNGERFRVTSNLAEALRMLRQPDKEVTMWIDAVCVNQTDKLEKNTQIPLMGRIYKSAAKVVAFLGKHDETSLKLFNVLMQKEEIDLFDLYLLQSAKQSLLRREYWQRAWIVQESLLACERYIQCGLERVSFSRLKEFHNVLISDVGHIELSPTDPERHTIMTLCRNDWHSRFDQLCSTTSELSIIDFLDGFLESQCGDPRDHIYAFLSLLPPKLKKDIEPNYEKPPGEVICKAIQAVIMATQSLYIITLRARQVLSSEKWQQSLPSWCPFFGVPYRNHPNTTVLEGDTRLRVADEEFARFSEDGKVLHVKGVRLGKICHTVPHFPQADRPFKELKAQHKNRLFYERKYAYKCIQFFLKWRCGDVDLNHTLFGELMCTTYLPRLLACLEGRARFDGHQISQMNDFAQSFHGMQLCAFRCADLIAYGGRNTKSPLNKQKLDFAIIPQRARCKDLLYVVHGCEQLVVLRRCRDQQGRFYRVVGDAKVYGHTGHDILSQVNAFVKQAIVTGFE